MASIFEASESSKNTSQPIVELWTKIDLSTAPKNKSLISVIIGDSTKYNNSLLKPPISIFDAIKKELYL